jgi:hypothetical protein
MIRQWPVVLLGLLTLRAAPGQAPLTRPSDASASQSLPKSELVVDGQSLGQSVTPRANDICIVCKRPLGAEGVVYLVNGQRVALHFAVCYNAFGKDPHAYLASLRPHGAFLGTDSEGTTPSWVWFLGGLYILIGLVFAALCAHRALYAGRNPAAWFAAGFLMNAFGYLWLLTRPRLAVPESVPGGLGKVATTYAPVPCPGCSALNHPAADRCINCGTKLQATFRSEVQKAGLRSQ